MYMASKQVVSPTDHLTVMGNWRSNLLYFYYQSQFSPFSLLIKLLICSVVRIYISIHIHCMRIDNIIVSCPVYGVPISNYFSITCPHLNYANIYTLIHFLCNTFFLFILAALTVRFYTQVLTTCSNP